MPDEPDIERLTRVEPGYVVLVERITKLEQLIRDVRQTLRFLMISVILGLLFLGAVSFYLRGQNAARAQEARQATLQIQASRRESALRACENDNHRNEAAGRLLTALFAARQQEPKTPADVNRIRRSQEATRRLVDAIVPHHVIPDPQTGELVDNCVRFVRDQTHVPLDGEGP